MKEIKSTATATVDNQSTFPVDIKPTATLRDLKVTLPSTNGKALPTVKQLRESDQVILSQPLSDGDIHVYASGFAVYRSDRHTAVLRVDRVSSHTYEFATADKSISLDDQPWAPALMLAGDKRMNEMLADRYSRRSIGFADDVDEEDSKNRERGEVVVIAGADDVEGTVVKKLSGDMERMLGTLTARQRQVVSLRYEGLTQQAIADRLRISKQTVNEYLQASAARIKKTFKKF